jgi:hypothetical protein
MVKQSVRSLRSVWVISWVYIILPSVLTAAHHTALLYYDYALTFDLELRLFWSQHSFKQWGSILFFLNRYFGVIGHVPFILQRVVRHNSALNRICKPFFPYRQILTFMMQTVIGCMFPMAYDLSAESWLTDDQRSSSRGLTPCITGAARCSLG